MKCARCYKELDCDISLCSLYCDDCMKLENEEAEEHKACMTISKNLIDKCKNCKKDFSSCHSKKRVCFRDVYGYEEAISPDLVLWCSDLEER
jgi:hypothetical protein